jgi:amidophosphoribosyltransferase
MEGSNIYVARKNIGRYLAKKFPFKDADLVIPVPDSARPAALGYAQELGIPFDEGLLKDRYSKKGPLRSFIEPHQADRVEINRWIIPIQEIIEGKHVIVVDDSLVRGISSRAIVKALRKGGARKISLVITYPPIKFPCFAGIDFPSQEELATYTDGKDYSDEQIIEKVRNDIGVDFLGYNDPENLARAIGIPVNSMCFTCATGDYSSLGIKPIFKGQVQTNNRK